MTTIDASLFDLLRETLPISAGVWAASYNSNKRDFVDLSVQDVHPYIAWIEPSKSFAIGTPALLANPRFDVHIQRLWTFEHDAADPATVSNVWCRVNNAGFVSHKVVERIEWGYEDMVSGIFEKAVLITTTEGKELKLPLTPEFVHTKLLVTDGFLPEGENPLWPLEMRLDRGMVIAFVYELGLDNVVAPWKDPDDASRTAYEGALKDITVHSKVHPCVAAPKPAPPRAPHAPPEVTDPNYTFVSNAPQEGIGYPEDWPEPPEENECAASSWGADISRGKLMPKSAAHGAVSGQVPATASAKVSPMKVLVVLSLATCRERADYEPGAVVGMARLYPHIMVRADVDLLEIQATVRYDRPDKTARAEPTDGIEGEATSCCRGYDAVHQEINSTLVADANDDVQKTPPGVPLLPFWGNMFNYYQTDAYQTLGQEKIKVVCNDRRGVRSDDSGLVERDVVLGFDSLTVSKTPHQGEFDNIHMAPKLRMVRVTHVYYPPPPDAPDNRKDKDSVTILDLVPVDVEKLGLDDISMAPFCAHDCFHMHWRWGSGATGKWVRGWDGRSAHQAAGAPLVPLNQNVYIWLRGPAKISVHHVIGSSDGGVESLVANEWQVAMYQGAAYAVQVEDLIKWSAVQLAYNYLAAPPTFYDCSVLFGIAPRKIMIVESTAMFYWYSRWHARYDFGHSKWEIVERLRSDPGRLAKARAF
jgi:hypothetical protein